MFNRVNYRGYVIRHKWLTVRHEVYEIMYDIYTVENGVSTVWPFRRLTQAKEFINNFLTKNEPAGITISFSQFN